MVHSRFVSLTRANRIFERDINRRRHDASNRFRVWDFVQFSCSGADERDGSAQTVSIGSLLDEMVARDQLACFPQPAYKCSQASSYDRGTVAADKPGWFANMDRSYFVRTEEKDGRKEYVLMDVDGPGAVVRMWATWHGPGGKDFSDGILRFYLDNNPDPVIEGPISKIIDGGALVTGPLSEGVSPETPYGQRGHNLYLPIPYAQHCKVTYETAVLVDEGAHNGEALYYQINYRTYSDTTQVESFKMEQLTQLKDKIDAVQKRLVDSGISERCSAENGIFRRSARSGQDAHVGD